MKIKEKLIIFSIGMILAICLGAYFSLAEDNHGTYVIFTVDTERDFPPVLNTYRGIDEGIPILLNIFEQYGVKATFLVTGNVAKMRPDVVKLISESHEVGNHSLYHIEPFYSLDYEEKYRRVEESTSILEEVTGKDITSFRSPGHSCDTELINILESFGYLVECSAYKGDSYPYHPSADNWEEGGDMNIMRIPITNAPYYFYSCFYYGQSWIDAYEYSIEQQNDKDVKVVVIGLHPWELCDLDLDEANAYTDRVCGQVTHDMLIELLDYLKDKDVKYITMYEAYQLLS